MSSSWSPFLLSFPFLSSAFLSFASLRFRFKSGGIESWPRNRKPTLVPSSWLSWSLRHRLHSHYKTFSAALSDFDSHPAATATTSPTYQSNRNVVRPIFVALFLSTDYSTVRLPIQHDSFYFFFYFLLLSSFLFLRGNNKRDFL